MPLTLEFPSLFLYCGGGFYYDFNELVIFSSIYLCLCECKWERERKGGWGCQWKTEKDKEYLETGVQVVVKCLTWELCVCVCAFICENTGIVSAVERMCRPEDNLEGHSSSSTLLETGSLCCFSPDYTRLTGFECLLGILSTSRIPVGRLKFKMLLPQIRFLCEFELRPSCLCSEYFCFLPIFIAPFHHWELN